ncbi:MAG: hypothetical protein P9M13_02980 [Candidatus Ancaeobacter aquaticus]|nr:hypothetical protein [Candidatus Ancaeobacter aquaticus]
MFRLSRSIVSIAFLCAFSLITIASVCAQNPGPPAPASADELISIQGNVVSIEPAKNNVSIKSEGDKVIKLHIDPKTTTIWGEFDEIPLAELEAGQNVAGEYKINPTGTMTATYLEIVTEDDLPDIEEVVEEETEVDVKKEPAKTKE